MTRACLLPRAPRATVTTSPSRSRYFSLARTATVTYRAECLRVQGPGATLPNLPGTTNRRCV